MLVRPEPDQHKGAVGEAAVGRAGPHPATGEITGEDVFIDIGCGMGPVLVEAAARYGFRRVGSSSLGRERAGAPNRTSSRS